MNRKLLFGAMAFAALGGIGYFVLHTAPQKTGTAAQTAAAAADPAATAPAVMVVKIAPADFVETVLITGSVVARDEILVAPEIEGLQVTELLAEEGDVVRKDQVLARLSADTLKAQLLQNDANIARATATIAVARSTIVQAEAAAKEAGNAFERAKPLKQSGYISGAVFDQRESAANTATSKVTAARDSLTSAEADKAALEAQRRELTWRLGRTEIRAPADGRISRRAARVGAVASAQASDAMFRIIARGEAELDAEVPEADVGKIKEGQKARVTVTGTGDFTGTVRLISSEVDRSTRLGKVRVFFGADPRLRLGAFGRGTIETGNSHGIAAPTSAVVFGPDGAIVQVVKGQRVETRPVKTGLKTRQQIEITEGLSEGEIVVAKSGSFLRDGDIVRPVTANSNVSGLDRGNVNP